MNDNALDIPHFRPRFHIRSLVLLAATRNNSVTVQEKEKGKKKRGSVKKLSLHVWL